MRIKSYPHTVSKGRTRYYDEKILEKVESLRAECKF